jgi:hypothetical protein
MQHIVGKTFAWDKFKAFFHHRKYNHKVAYGDLILAAGLIVYSIINQTVWFYIHNPY